MRNRPHSRRTETKVNPYRISARTARGLQAVTGGRLGLDLMDSLASVLGRFEVKYLQVETYYPGLFAGAMSGVEFVQDLNSWAATLGKVSELATSQAYGPTVRGHAVAAHEFGCIRFAMAIRLWWAAAGGRVEPVLGYWDLQHTLGHFRWEADLAPGVSGLFIAGDRVSWVTSRHFEITRSLGCEA